MARRRDILDPTLVAVGAALKKLTAEAGLRQQDVAAALGIGLRTYASYLAGGGEIPLSVVIKAAPLLGMTPASLTDHLANAALAAHIVGRGGSEGDVADTLRRLEGDFSET